MSLDCCSLPGELTGSAGLAGAVAGSFAAGSADAGPDAATEVPIRESLPLLDSAPSGAAGLASPTSSVGIAILLIPNKRNRHFPTSACRRQPLCARAAPR